MPFWFAVSSPLLGVLVALLALPAGASANTSGPIAQTGGMTTVIPLLGSSLTVAVTLDVVGTFNNGSRRNYPHHADQSIQIDKLRNFRDIRRLATKRIGISL